MDKQSVPVLTKSAPFSGGSPAEPGRAYNAATMAALQEASDIMSGKKKGEWSHFQPGTTKAEIKKELKKRLGF